MCLAFPKQLDFAVVKGESLTLKAHGSLGLLKDCEDGLLHDSSKVNTLTYPAWEHPFLKCLPQPLRFGGRRRTSAGCAIQMYLRRSQRTHLRRLGCGGTHGALPRPVSVAPSRSRYRTPALP